MLHSAPGVTSAADNGGTVPTAHQPGAASAAPGLGTSRIEFHPDAQARQAGYRRGRFQRRQTSSGWLIADAREAKGLPADGDGIGAADLAWVRPPRPARCRWRVADEVGVHHEQGQPAHYSGLERCASIGACPVCSAVIRAERAEEIQEAARLWSEQGGAVAMLTMTVRHRRSDPLSRGLDAALGAWRKMLAGKAWKQIKARYGIGGYVRALEVTRTPDNGWHPHLHVLLFLDARLDGLQLQELSDVLFARWQRYVVALGGRVPSYERGIDLRQATDDGTVVAAYLAKVQEAGVGKEMARGDLKTGRRGSVTPFELLDHDTIANRRLWSEYVATIKGRRFITWSVGLRDSLGLDTERTDEQVMDDVQSRPLVFDIPGGVYDRELANDPEALALVLDLVETDDADQAALICGAGDTPDTTEWLYDVPISDSV